MPMVESAGALVNQEAAANVAEVVAIVESEEPGAVTVNVVPEEAEKEEGAFTEVKTAKMKRECTTSKMLEKVLSEARIEEEE